MEASPLDCSTGDASQVASSGLSPLLEPQVKAKVDTSEGSSRDRRVDQGDGQEQSTLGSRTYSGRITVTGYSCVQTHNPEIPASCVSTSTKGTELENLPAQSRCRDLGLRFFVGACFDRVAATSNMKILKTPYYAPRANAICERFLGSV